MEIWVNNDTCVSASDKVAYCVNFAINLSFHTWVFRQTVANWKIIGNYINKYYCSSDSQMCTTNVLHVCIFRTYVVLFPLIKFVFYLYSLHLCSLFNYKKIKYRKNLHFLMNYTVKFCLWFTQDTILTTGPELLSNPNYQ